MFSTNESFTLIAHIEGRTGGSMTACLNAANERANELFRGEKLGYLGAPYANDDMFCLFEM